MCQPTDEYTGQPFTAIELRMQFLTLEHMVGEAYREWDELGRLHGEWGLLSDISPAGVLALAQRKELADRYERLRGYYRATMDAYYAVSLDNSYEIRQGW